jgi:tripartite-type tricarboxylate transporter receptor subunit TctC
MRVPALGVALAAIAAISVPCTAATSYPSKPVRVLAAGAAAGPIDIMSRVVMQKLSEQVGQPIVIDNRGGAGGTIATRLAAQANPDGYTLLCNSSQYVVAVSLYRQPGYDAFRDFAPIINAGSSPNMIFANPSAGINNLTELLALSKNRKLTYGSAGAGSTPHLTGERLFRLLARLDVTHVPYSSAAPAIQAVTGGRCRSGSRRCRRRSSSSKRGNSAASR